MTSPKPAAWVTMGAVSQVYTLDEASGLLPDVALRAKVLGTVQSRLEAEIKARPLHRGTDSYRSAEAFALNEQMHRIVAWFGERYIQIKGLAPALIDFPARSGEDTVLLCWREGEDEIGWFHRPEDGFAGRRPVTELAD